MIVLRRKIENAFFLFDFRPVNLVADPGGAASLDLVEEFVRAGPILAEVRLDAEKSAAPGRRAWMRRKARRSVRPDARMRRSAEPQSAEASQAGQLETALEESPAGYCVDGTLLPSGRITGIISISELREYNPAQRRGQTYFLRIST
jgi:hypothetical protein